MAKFSDNISLPSLPQYVLWRLRGSKGRVRILLKNGLNMVVRGGTHDSHVASEIFVHHQYDAPEGLTLDNITTIVDTGANVGFASLHFLAQFPQSSVTAFEPHPDHIKQIQEHIALNRLEKRWKLVEAAAGVAPGQIQFLDDGCCSATIDNQGEGTTLSDQMITVPVVDWFKAIPESTIDILKLDAEGAEYDLMADSRFAEVAARTRFIVMEWHNTNQHTNGKQWCVEKLQEMKFVVQEGSTQYGVAGFLWASRLH